MRCWCLCLQGRLATPLLPPSYPPVTIVVGPAARVSCCCWCVREEEEEAEARSMRCSHSLSRSCSTSTRRSTATCVCSRDCISWDGGKGGQPGRTGRQAGTMGQEGRRVGAQGRGEGGWYLPVCVWRAPGWPAGAVGCGGTCCPCLIHHPSIHITTGGLSLSADMTSRCLTVCVCGGYGWLALASGVAASVWWRASAWPPPPRTTTGGPPHAACLDDQHPPTHPTHHGIAFRPARQPGRRVNQEADLRPVGPGGHSRENLLFILLISGWSTMPACLPASRLAYLLSSSADRTLSATRHQRHT